MTERLGAGLQIRSRRFDPGYHVAISVLYALDMRYMVHARSEDGLSGEDLVIVADSAEAAIAKYEVAHGDSALPVVTTTTLGA